MMEISEAAVNQLELLESPGTVIPVGTESGWDEEEDEEEEEEEEEDQHSEEWFLLQEQRREQNPTELMLWATENNRLSTLERLLQADSSLVNCRDDDGYTPLHRAAYTGHAPLVCFLLDSRAELHARTSEGWTPLHSASRWGHVAVVSALLHRGAEPNVLTQGRLTPLQLAAGNPAAGHTLELLLSQRTLRAELRNGAGETAYDIALRTSAHHFLFEMSESCNNVLP